MHVAGVGKVCLITILDVVSRWHRSRVIPVSTRPIQPSTPINCCSDVPRLSTGLPRRFSLDHGMVFYDNTSPSPFPTRLHLWLLALGIDVCFTRKRSPTDHAKIERTHQTMTLQALLGQHWPDQTALWAGLDARRAMLNAHIPSGVLQGRAPLQAYPRASHSGRSYRPEWEAEMLDLARVCAYLANGRWFRRIRANGQLDLGGYDSYLGTTRRNQMLELHFDAEQGCFLGQPAGSNTAITYAPRGLTKTDLMGELGHLLALPVYQLALPFTHEAWHQLEYTHVLTGTTF